MKIRFDEAAFIFKRSRRRCFHVCVSVILVVVEAIIISRVL